VGREDDLHPIVDIEDFRVVIHLFGDQGDAREEAPGFGEIAEMIAFADRIAIVDLGPAVQCRECRVARRADQLFDHVILPITRHRASEWRRWPGQAGILR
jgi:hypothetical protein